MKFGSLALLTIVNSGASTGVVTVLEQRIAVLGQVGSPPPETFAVFDSIVPLASAVGVTGMMKLADAPTLRLAATVHVTCWPLALQGAVTLPTVNVLGMLSVIVAVAVVAAVPVFVTRKV